MEQVAGDRNAQGRILIQIQKWSFQRRAAVKGNVSENKLSKKRWKHGTTNIWLKSRRNVPMYGQFGNGFWIIINQVEKKGGKRTPQTKPTGSRGTHCM